MCLHGMTKTIIIGNEKKVVTVDKCLVGIIKALNGNGLSTVESCCGHGKTSGSIWLEDGREIEIHALNREYKNNEEKK